VFSGAADRGPSLSTDRERVSGALEGERVAVVRCFTTELRWHWLRATSSGNVTRCPGIYWCWFWGTISGFGSPVWRPPAGDGPNSPAQTRPYYTVLLLLFSARRLRAVCRPALMRSFFLVARSGVLPDLVVVGRWKLRYWMLVEGAGFSLIAVTLLDDSRGWS